MLRWDDFKYILNGGIVLAVVAFDKDTQMWQAWRCVVGTQSPLIGEAETRHLAQRLAEDAFGGRVQAHVNGKWHDES